MIRVNLLPYAAERRGAPQASQAWLVLVMVLVVAEIIGLFFFHQTKVDELAEATSEVNAVQGQIAEIQARVKDHQKIKDELEVLRAREDAIAKLQQARTGPTGVMLELGRVLTKGKGPTVDPEKLEEQRKQNPLSVYNPVWDPKRVWITTYAESERSVRLEGIARDGGDVYEFAQRLKLSEYFTDVKLQKGGKSSANASNKDAVELVDFALVVKVNY